MTAIGGVNVYSNV